MTSDTHKASNSAAGPQHEGRAPRDLLIPGAAPAACDGAGNPGAPSHLPSNCTGARGGRGACSGGASWPSSRSCSGVAPESLTFAPRTPGAIFPLTHVSRGICAKGTESPRT